MKPIPFSREETAAITGKLRDYFRDELEVELAVTERPSLISPVNALLIA